MKPNVKLGFKPGLYVLMVNVWGLIMCILSI